MLPTTTRDDELMKTDEDEKEGWQTSGPNSLVAEDCGFKDLDDSNVKQTAMTISDYCMHPTMNFEEKAAIVPFGIAYDDLTEQQIARIEASKKKAAQLREQRKRALTLQSSAISIK